MKFINLNGKRLWQDQKSEIAESGIETISESTNDEELRAIFDCDGKLSYSEYKNKVEKLIGKFEIESEDWIHINGIDSNLIIVMMDLLPTCKYVFSKMKKIDSHVQFMGFVELIKFTCKK